MLNLPLVPPESVSPRILVMDECAEILDLLRDVLGEDGVRLILRRELLSLDEIRQLRPALIIMERRFGGSIAESWMRICEVRSDPELAGVPIVLCTTDSASRLSLSQQRDLQALGIQVLVKPFPLEDLRGLVQGTRARNLTEGQQAQPRRLKALPGQTARRDSRFLEDVHHEPARPDHGAPLSGWSPRRS